MNINEFFKIYLLYRGYDFMPHLRRLIRMRLDQAPHSELLSHWILTTWSLDRVVQ